MQKPMQIITRGYCFSEQPYLCRIVPIDSKPKIMQTGRQRLTTNLLQIQLQEPEITPTWQK
jgi:hypothetical protein